MMASDQLQVPHSPSSTGSRRRSATLLDCDIKDAQVELVFDYIDADNSGSICAQDILDVIAANGIPETDPRIKNMCDNLKSRLGSRGLLRKSKVSNKKLTLTPREFDEIAGCDVQFLEKVVTGGLIVPDWTDFTRRLEETFRISAANRSGELAKDIPQLAKVDPELFAMSVCTVDGQQFSIGDWDTNFCLEACMNPLNYLQILEEHGEEVVEKYIGVEPSGGDYNRIGLGANGIPHNPLVNTGAILACSLIKPGLNISERFEAIVDFYKKLAGGARVGFDNSAYLSERVTNYRNYCIGYMLREKNLFPPGTDMKQVLDLYFQCGSIQLHCQDLAVVGSTLATGGICPTTLERVCSSSGVCKTLAIMNTCGMYNFSGEWAFRIGVPSKSGVGGAIFSVIPGFGGIAVYSPRLDTKGNSVRGVEFFQHLIKGFNFHHFELARFAKDEFNEEEHIDNEEREDKGQLQDPTVRKKHEFVEAQLDDVIELLYACARGNICDVQRYVAHGFDINISDYDSRTALHLAASNGFLEVVRYLAYLGADQSAKDRLGNTPLDDAVRGHHIAVEDFLRKQISS